MEHITTQRNGAPRLLVVEDEPAVRLAIMRCLEHVSRFDLWGTSTVEKARAFIAEQGAPDAILLDLMLPDRPGTDLLCDVRTQDLPIRVVLWTGATEGNPELQRALRCGPDAVLFKPVSNVMQVLASLLPAEGPVNGPDEGADAP